MAEPPDIAALDTPVAWTDASGQLAGGTCAPGTDPPAT